ncbi:MAG TPA: DUF362 domain-containing protein [Caldithrix abyssi]|uniref:DUF362 domain-containing protein n=1 Tax=Caldithrix abyssi TaxID=187145 RepID=A0A7V4WU47_CALAY|nr:DUF362 domain-containing protein [Caldithrix abyssi]
MKRREFIKKSLSLSSGIILPVQASSFRLKPPTDGRKSTVVISRLAQQHIKADARQISTLLDKALMAFFNRDDPISAWKQVVRPGERVGLKVNCLAGRGSTHTALVDHIAERLQEAGIDAGDILIWDRFNRDLEDGGFTIRDSGNRVRCYGNDSVGFEYDLQMYGSAASRVTKIVTRQCDAIINLPLLKDHSIAGVTCSLKNMFGAIHNPNKFHIKHGDPYIADVNRYPALYGKIRLHICDALEAQYQGGPSFMPHWRWIYNGLLVAQDPVALDYTGWQIIEKKRKEMGLPSLKEEKREPGYIATAADWDHRLGTNNPKEILIKNETV